MSSVITTHYGAATQKLVMRTVYGRAPARIGGHFFALRNGGLQCGKTLLGRGWAFRVCNHADVIVDLHFDRFRALALLDDKAQHGMAVDRVPLRARGSSSDYGRV
jgi:hypothetical protein